MNGLRLAPEFQIARWLNAREPVTLAGLKGKTVFAVAFQMLCPGCVANCLPQAARVRAAFAESDLAVIGLHTVFEHHEAQGSAEALAAFLHEYRIKYPVGIDAQPEGGGLPKTMRAYNMQGTPTTILIDREGRLRMQKFGHVEDLILGASIATLIGEAASASRRYEAAACDDEGCRAH